MAGIDITIAGAGTYPLLSVLFQQELGLFRESLLCVNLSRMLLYIEGFLNFKPKGAGEYLLPQHLFSIYAEYHRISS
jgi:hypothetical protein